MNIKASAYYGNGWDIVQFDDNSIKFMSHNGYTKKKLRKAAKNLGVSFTRDTIIDGKRVLGENTQILGAILIKALNEKNKKAA